MYDFRLLIVFTVIVTIYGSYIIESKSSTNKDIESGSCQQLDLETNRLVSINCSTIVNTPRLNHKASNMEVFLFEPIPINHASYMLLQTVKGVGPKLALNIINYRERFGAFSDRNTLEKLAGVGDKRARYLATQFSFD